MNKFFLSFLFLGITTISLSQDLIKLIKTGDLAAIKKMESKGSDIHQILDIRYQYPGDEEESYAEMHPMNYAAARNQIEIVKFYLEKKDEIEEYTGWSWVLGQSFICAMSTKNESLIQLLYDQNPDFSEVCESCRGHNAVMVAAAYGLDKWYFLLKEKSDLILRNSKGATLIHIAIAGGSVAILEDVVKSGNYDLNYGDDEGFTPLDYAVLNSNIDAFNYLLKQGSDANESAMLWFSVSQSGNMEIFKWLVENYNHRALFEYNENYELPLYFALGFNHTEISLEMIRMMKASIEKSGVVSMETFDMTETNMLYWTIDFQNKVTYEAVLDFASFLNTRMEDPEFIVFPKDLLKMANKTFGKAFVTALNEKYQVGWY